jgi:hypothetical protein
MLTNQNIYVKILEYRIAPDYIFELRRLND